MKNMVLKQGLTSNQLVMVQSEFDKKKKNKGVMYACWWFGCAIGLHRFYLGNTGYAIAMLLCGWLTLFIWNVVDVFFIGKKLEEINERIEYEIIQQVKMISPQS